MKSALILVLALGLTSALPATAAKPKPAGKKTQRQEQKATLNELREKYDLDKDGKLSKQERAAISADDKAKLQKLRTDRKKKQESK